MSIGHSPNVGPHKPDMKKDEANITMEDRQEARRRIEGSIAPDLDDMAMLPHDTEVGEMADTYADAPAMSSLHPANVS